LVKGKTAAVMFSGGKDSTRAVERLTAVGIAVSCLITMISKNPDSYMLHTPNIRLTELSSKALEIPIVFGYTEGEKELELDEMKQTILSAKKTYNFDVLASGAIASAYQKSRLQKISEECGLRCENPLWGADQEAYMKSLVGDGYRFVLTSVSASGLDDSWLGKELDGDSVLQLISLSKRFGFNAALEGGEGETLVLDCPIFLRERIRIVEASKVWDGYTGSLNITNAELVQK
jgi:diphthine-ammonia ligase